ncbi:MAG: histidine kinase [Cytophagales bacterium]|nr:histidine kinase [Cytophagales bacterium]
MVNNDEERYKQINELIISYSLGDFSQKINPSLQRDPIDSIISGINMLGEELNASTISKLYFNNIFDSVSDMIMVLNHQGTITNINLKVTEILGYDDTLIGTPLIDLLQDHTLIQEIKNDERYLLQRIESVIISKNGAEIPILSQGSVLKKNDIGDTEFLLLINDNRKNIEMRNALIKTIVETQEKERERFARDLHDSLGQKLSAIKFYIATLDEINKNTKVTSLIVKSNDMLMGAIQELRNIIFNLMPQTLQAHGLVAAVEEYIYHNLAYPHLKFELHHTENLPRFKEPFEIAIFRVIQELTHNSIKHSEGDIIKINIELQADTLLLDYSDNGKGMTQSNENVIKKTGMGIKNIKSRINSYFGEVKIQNIKPQGLHYHITIPNIWTQLKENY